MFDKRKVKNNAIHLSITIDSSSLRVGNR